MKPLICLYGEYSSWWKLNDWVYDKDIIIYGITTSTLEPIDVKRFKEFKYIDASFLIHLHQLDQHSQRQYLKEYIQPHFNNHFNHQFNQPIIYAHFRDIFSLNSENRFEIVSYTHVRVNQGLPTYIYNLEKSIRLELFNMMFKGNVNDIDTLPICFSHRIVFFTPSVIHVSSNPFDYIHFRSVFTPHERYIQTLYQSRDIHQLATPVHHYILEGSFLNLYELKEFVDMGSRVVLFCTDGKGNEYANHHPNKSLFELYTIRKMMDKIPEATWYLKFGGRYRLTPEFELDRLLRNVPVMFKIDKDKALGKQDIIECILYSFPKSYLETFASSFDRMIGRAEKSSESVERMMYTYIAKCIMYEQLLYIGIVGRDAIEGRERMV